MMKTLSRRKPSQKRRQYKLREDTAVYAVDSPATVDAGDAMSPDDEAIYNARRRGERKLPAVTILPWLRELGGYCDSEIIYNVEDKFREMVGSR